MEDLQHQVFIVYLDEIESDKVPVRLRAWEPFRLFHDFDKESERLIKWLQSQPNDLIGKETIQPETPPPLAAKQAIGPSGTGKSSLVAAGLVPALRDQHPALTYLSFKPRANPYKELAEALDQALPENRLSFGPPRDEQIAQALEKGH
jgi:hypothetical protein